MPVYSTYCEHYKIFLKYIWTFNFKKIGIWSVAKSSYLSALWVNQNMLGADVSMDTSILVELCQSFGHVSKDLKNIFSDRVFCAMPRIYVLIERHRFLTIPFRLLERQEIIYFSKRSVLNSPSTDVDRLNSGLGTTYIHHVKNAHPHNFVYRWMPTVTLVFLIFFVYIWMFIVEWSLKFVRLDSVPTGLRRVYECRTRPCFLVVPTPHY